MSFEFFHIQLKLTTTIPEKKKQRKKLRCYRKTKNVYSGFVQNHTANSYKNDTEIMRKSRFGK